MAKFSMQKDPRVYARGLAPKDPEKKRALAIDLGTNSGIAFIDFTPGQPVFDEPVWLDQWDLSIGQYDTTALRHCRLKQFLSVVRPDLVGFEEVKVDVPLDLFRDKPGALVARIVPTAEFIGALKTTLTVWCHERDIPCQGFPIAYIKKAATGKGNANKVDMINAANEQFGCTLDPADYESTGVDNIADAAHILKILLETYSEGLDGSTQEPISDAAVEAGEAEVTAEAERTSRRRRAAGGAGKGDNSSKRSRRKDSKGAAD